MLKAKGFQFTDQDLEILRWVDSLRLAHVGHLCALTERSEKALSRRLLKLQQHRYLACITRRPAKHLYVVGSEGMPALIEAGFAEDDLRARRPRHFELKDLWLRHFLLVVDVHVQIILSARRSTVSVIQWREGPTLWDRVTLFNRDSEVIAAVRPDAFFALRDTARREGKDVQYFFLEADRSTMSHTRIEDKIRAYVNYFQQGLHSKKYPGVKLFQVLVVTQTTARAGNLATSMRSVVPAGAQRWYHFFSLQQLTLDALLPAAPPLAREA